MGVGGGACRSSTTAAAGPASSRSVRRTVCMMMASRGAAVLARASAATVSARARHTMASNASATPLKIKTAGPWLSPTRYVMIVPSTIMNPEYMGKAIELGRRDIAHEHRKSALPTKYPPSSKLKRLEENSKFEIPSEKPCKSIATDKQIAVNSCPHIYSGINTGPSHLHRTRTVGQIPHAIKFATDKTNASD